MPDGHLQSVVHTALDGEGVLFVGYGFSRTATNVRGENLKTATELAEFMCQELDLDEPATLSEVAEMFADDRSNAALASLLREQYQVRDIASEHSVFGRIPWRRVYTTNYDDVIELAYRSTNTPISSLTPSDDIRNVSSEHPQCVHINGYIGNLTEDRLFSDFKLTDTSYATSSFVTSPWAQQMSHDLSVARAAVFVGYSLYDIDVRRLLRATRGQLDKTFFFVGPRPSRVLRHRLSRFGTVVTLDTAALATVIQSEISTYTPKNPEPILGRVVVQRKANSATEAPQDRDIANLFLWGSTNHDLVWATVTGTANWRYICYRDALDRVLEQLESGEKNIVVRSDLGNGKSIFLDSLDCLASNFGFEVYRIDTLADEFEGEVEAVARARLRTLLIVDSYNNKRDALEIIARNRSDELHLVCAARSIRHDVSFRWLHQVLGTNAIPEFDLEMLSERECKWFRATLDEYGLWGRYASRSPEAKERVIKNNCKSRISAVLLLILESPVIAERLATVVDSLRSRREYLETITALLVLSVLDFCPTIGMLADLMGADVLNQTDFQRNETVQELLDFREEGARVRSNVVAKHLLKNTIDRAISLSVLKRLVSRAEQLRNKVFFRELFKELMRSANVERVLPDGSGVVVTYYEFVCKLYGARRNPNFWLQYAIANIAMNRYQQARLKLETAYSPAGRDYDTFMLDTTHARWLLEEACEMPKPNREVAMAAFRKARNFLQPLLATREERYNPFRVASNYMRFFVQYRGILNAKDRAEVGAAAEFVLQRIESLPATRREQRYIRECSRELVYLIGLCG